MLALIVTILAVLTPAFSVLLPASSDYCAQLGELSPPTAKDTFGNEIQSANVSQQVLIFSTFSNPCQYDQQIVIVNEIRDHEGTTVFFERVPIDAGALNSSEVGLLWSAKNAGPYELRSFAISETDRSELLTDVQTSKLMIVDYQLVSA